jgi:endoglucanase
MFVILAPSLALSQGTGYWHTSGSQLLDSKNKTVRITGINWYGFETGDAVAHGLWAQDYHTILNTIQAEGFNTIRIPFSNQMVESPSIPSNIHYSGPTGAINTDLKGLNSLQILDKIVQAAGQLGIRVILDNHRSEAGNSNEGSGLWYTSAYPEANWIADWTALATRYKSFADPSGNPIVIGMDLRNEPHVTGYSGYSGACWTGDTAVNGCPTSNTAQNWPAAATRAGNAVLKANTGLLIFVEGTDCYSGDCGWQGANLEGAGRYPVQLSVANQLVYSAHDYGPDLYQQSWFNGSTSSSSLAATWNKYWGYLSTGNTAPVWLGEFGTTNSTSDVENNSPGSQGQWFQSLISYLGNHPSIQWTYWALNGEDSFGLLDGNYDTPPTSALKEQLLSSIRFTLAGEIPAKPCATLPAAPAGMAATAGSSSAITLKWSAVTPPANCPVSYNVYRSTASTFTPSTSNQVASGLGTAGFADKGLAAATKYSYIVETTDAKGSSKASAVASAKTASANVNSASSCHVTYSVLSDWGNGFQGAISIANTSSTPVTSWTLQWSFPQQQQIINAWNTNVTQTGKNIVMTSVAYDGTIPAASSITSIGFIGNYSGTNTAPTSFMVNGVACN